ncbi:MAG: ABC transporter ATP-binding protein/permease [Cumulibacter sp.]
MAKRGLQGAMMRSFGAHDHEATVTGTELLAPDFLRIRMHSPTLLQEAEVAPTAWLRFWFPDPDGGETEYQRAYTLSEVDPESGTFAVDVVLHEPAGPASAWARRAEVGSRIAATSLGSSRFDLPDEFPAGYLIVGDSASIPGINGILRTVPHHVRIEVYLEQHSENDLLIPLVEHPRAVVHWIPRNGESSLAASIEARNWSDWYAWAATESGSLKALRSRLRDEFGFPKSEIHAQAYWFYGRAFGKNRSKADPEPDRTPQSPAPESTAGGPTPPATAAKSPPTAPTGAWRAQAGSRLLASMRPTFIIAGIAQALITLLQLAPYVLLVELAHLLITGAPSGDLWQVGIWAVALMGAGVLLSAALLLWMHYVDAQFSHVLRKRLLRKLSRVPLGWFDARGSGSVKQLIQDDTLSLHYLITHAVPDAVAATVAPIAVLTYLFVVDWRLALVLFLPVLAYIVAMWVMLVRSGTKPAQAMRWAERMNTEAGAYIEGQPVVRVFGGAASSTFRAQLGEYIDFLATWQRPLNGQKTFIDLVTRPATFLVLICIFGTLIITSGGMPPVDLLPFLLLGTTFGSRLLGIGYGLGGLRDGLMAARRIQVALDERELDTTKMHNASTLDRLVEFDEVGFSYRDGVRVLQDVSMRLDPGTMTALVGPSGSGKSTLAALLARFHDVEDGAIRIGGRDLRELGPDELYARVGFVFQQTQLVRGTVRDNIALAAPDATGEQIESAARAAQIHDRILELPGGYDTVLGPDAALSGGERQRLTIARAILADTPILVLDEATAFADPESEFLVQQALTALTRGRTVLVIAHRLHTVSGADQIVVLDDGRVQERGTHQELLDAGGRYSQLWNATSAEVYR